MAPIMKALALIAFLVAPITVNGAPLNRRQLAGEGDACSSILSGTDNGVGYGIENALDNTAAAIGGLPKPGAPPQARSLRRRQGDKIANGVAAVVAALGQPAVAGYIAENGDAVDSDLTSDAATDGAQVGALEESVLEGAGSLVV